jgi:ketol-acid reductoisomerase
MIGSDGHPESNVYREEDADLEILKEKTIAIIGYGNQGRSQALNLADSGLNVIVGNREDSSREQAEEDGFAVYEMGKATERADAVFLLLPDEVAPAIYEAKIAPNLSPGDVLNFASGYNITYGFIEPADDLDVLMIAPRMVGAVVREMYEDDDGAPSFMAVNQDASGEAKERALALAEGIGSTRSGVIEVTFEMETKLDLLNEQFLAPVIFNAMMAKYEIEIEDDIPPEAILLEMYLSKEYSHTFEKMAELGVIEQMSLHSQTSQYGQLVRSDAFDNESLKRFMREQFEKVENGEFAREWSLEQEMNYPVMDRLYNKYRESDFIRDEQRTMDILGLRDDE